MEHDVDCILSPDSDGFLCGLFMSHVLNWKVSGFYDGKVLVAKKGVDVGKSVFLDIEVFRNNVRSVGHHMLLYNCNETPPNWRLWDSCFQPNILRKYDALHSFRVKYPLATIHLLLATIGTELKVRLPDSATCPLLFTDGTFNVLFRYPENVLDWLRFLGASNIQNPLNTLFINEKTSVHSLMISMDRFFGSRDSFSVSRERGDRLKISQKDGTIANLVNQSNAYSIAKDAQNRVEGFIMLLAKLTGWKYERDLWSWDDFVVKKFSKRIIKNINGTSYAEIIRKQPLSWAITAQKQIEYTIESPDEIFA